MDVNAVLFTLVVCTGTEVDPLHGATVVALVVQRQPDTGFWAEAERLASDAAVKE